MADNIFEQLSQIQSLLSEMRSFSVETAPYKEKDTKKYYKLTCSVKFMIYYKYVAVDGDGELKSEIEKFGSEISTDDLRGIESIEVTVKDCLQDFIGRYEKKIQKWYFRSNWDASQGRNAKMDAMFDEVRNTPVFHTYSALRKWEQFEKYCEKLLAFCERAGLSVKEYRTYLNRLEKADNMDEEYRDICSELERKMGDAVLRITNKIRPRKQGTALKMPTSTCSYEIHEDKLKFLFWKAEYSMTGGPLGMPLEVACILTDTELNIIDKWQYTENKTAPQELSAKLEAVLKENYLIIFGWPASFASLRHFLKPNTYMTCDLGVLYARVVGKRDQYMSLDKMSDIVLEERTSKRDTSMADANQVLSVFKELCNLRGESPCDMMRFFGMKLKGN